MSKDVDTFESHRPDLLALAYRMLGEMGRAEDMVQEAWVRWQKRTVEVDSPRAYLIKVVTRLCLNELDSARARREESRPDRLPEPITLDASGVGRVEVLDQISMAFLVVLQRLTPAERAVLLLHDVFDFSHAEIAELLGKTDAACRQLLSRARQNVSAERRALNPSSQEHRQLLRAFLKAASAGDVGDLKKLLADDAVMIADGGPEGVRIKGVRATRGRRLARGQSVGGHPPGGGGGAHPARLLAGGPRAPQAHRTHPLKRLPWSFRRTYRSSPRVRIPSPVWKNPSFLSLDGARGHSKT